MHVYLRPVKGDARAQQLSACLLQGQIRLLIAPCSSSSKGASTSAVSGRCCRFHGTTMPKGRQRHCYAPGCRTGYAGVKTATKLSLFSVPKDEERRKVWEKNLHRMDKPLDENCSVCELHFEERYILRDYVHIVDGREVRIPRGIPMLRSDAVPTILPNVPKYLTTKVPSRREPTKREASAESEVASKKKKGDQDNQDPCTSADLPELIEDMSPNLDCENVHNLITPSEYWSKHRFPSFEGVVYALSELQPSSGTVTSERSVIFSVSEAQEASFKTFLIGRTVTEGTVRTVSEAERALYWASKLLKCPGAMSSTAMRTEDLTNALRSKITLVGGTFHNKECTGIAATEGKLQAIGKFSYIVIY